MASKANSAWEKKLGIITAAADYEKDDKIIPAMSPPITLCWKGLPKADLSQEKMCSSITAAVRAG